LGWGKKTHQKKNPNTNNGQKGGKVPQKEHGGDPQITGSKKEQARTKTGKSKPGGPRKKKRQKKGGRFGLPSGNPPESPKEGKEVPKKRIPIEKIDLSPISITTKSGCGPQWFEDNKQKDRKKKKGKKSPNAPRFQGGGGGPTFKSRLGGGGLFWGGGGFFGVKLFGFGGEKTRSFPTVGYGGHLSTWPSKWGRRGGPLTSQKKKQQGGGKRKEGCKHTLEGRNRIFGWILGVSGGGGSCLK